MSDNEYSDLDIESNDASPGTTCLDDSKKHARAQHNALERRRRDNIKDMYSLLKEEFTMTNSERVSIASIIYLLFKASRAHILKKTIEQIESQNAEVKQLDDEVNKLREQNARLMAEIREREAANSNPSTTLPNN
jgi:SMC interacting uncharacterized protein involved in chromosome segregation